MSVESKGKSVPFSSLKPQSSPSKATGVEKLINMGLDLLKRKKSSSSSSLSKRPGNLENVHQLRLLHNRLLLWRYANARAEAVNGSITIQAVRKFMCAWDALTKLQHSVVEKKLQVEKEKVDMKLNDILSPQIKLLEAWEDMERPHISAVSRIVECLHIVVSKVPLTDGSSGDIELAKITLGRALDLTASIMSICTNLAPSTENIVTLLSELAEVIAQEKFLLEWCLELLRTTSTLEIHFNLSLSLSLPPPLRRVLSPNLLSFRPPHPPLELCGSITPALCNKSSRLASPFPHGFSPPLAFL
ncbi:hypothetical protein F2P56_008731, partial [Juglans regia]